MITDQHDVSNLKLGVEPSSCIGDDQCIHSQKAENPHRECHLGSRDQKNFNLPMHVYIIHIIKEEIEEEQKSV